MARIYAGEWSPEYGSPQQLEEDVSGDAVLWEHERLEAVPCPETRPRLAFVDGVRAIEASLWYADGDNEPLPGLAGVVAAGAVTPDASGRLRVSHAVVKRMAIFGGGRQAQLPDQPGGWHWETFSTEGTSQDAPQLEMISRMRQVEALLAQELAGAGHVVLTDGPLEVRGMGCEAVGYIKTHHRRLLPPEHHDLIATLRGGERSSLFTVSQRHSCYFRLVDRGGDWHPWFGMVRLEVPGDLAREEARRLVDLACGALPRYSGVAHCDKRAPQNLQPIAALEKELRRRCGDRALALRAVRAAVREMAPQPKDVLRDLGLKPVLEEVHS